MKLNSIKFKFLLTIVSSILAITIFIGGLSVYEVDQFIQRESEKYIKVTCEKEATQVNDIFGDMEKSVNIMSGYVLDYFESYEDATSREKQAEVVKSAERMFFDVANHTDSTVAYYLRFAMEVSDSTTGFFYCKTKRGKDFVRFATTDIDEYDRDDTEHVGWYWQPYDAGKPIWMQPYYNQNNDIMMISYVIPLYCEGHFIGVVGMDFDFNVLTNAVHEMKVYENGFAHLEYDGTPVHYDGNYEEYPPEDYLRVSSKLDNGMELVLSASYDDIRQIRGDIVLKILQIVLIIAVVFCLITIVMVERIVKPLKKLTEASKKLADGDYEMEPIRSGTYEIQLLSTAFENMTMNLREHENLQYLLAYRDSMTGLRNTTSYKVWVSDFDKEIQSTEMDFGVIVLDVNYLKETNDMYGHDVGNKLIIAVGQLISGIFKRSPVFRIGGDEFLVILQNRDLEDYEELCEKFDMECANQYIEASGENIPISVARGFARYNREADTQFVDVFNRADDAMYKHKRRTKSSGISKWFVREKDPADVNAE